MEADNSGGNAGETVEVVKGRIDALQEEIISEFEAIREKLPWWQQALIWGGGTLAIIGGIAACAAISGATGPAYAIAVALCIAAALALIIDIIAGVIVYLDESGEADEIDKKQLRLKELTETLEAMKAALEENS